MQTLTELMEEIFGKPVYSIDGFMKKDEFRNDLIKVAQAAIEATRLDKIKRIGYSEISDALDDCWNAAEAQ